MNRKATRTAEERKEHLPIPAKRLLLVDDNEPLREVLNEVAQQWSFETSTAATLRQAQNVVLTEGPFAIIVSDYQLPDGNGLGFLDWLRRDMEIHVPFLLISGGVVPLRSPADDYEFLAKPFQMEQFHSRLEKLSCSKRQPAPSFHLSAARAAMALV